MDVSGVYVLGKQGSGIVGNERKYTMPKMPKVKDPYQDLPEEWKDAVAQGTVEEINARISEVAKAEALNQEAKEQDLDLASLKEQVKEAGAQYSEATKANKMKIKFCMRVLGDRGQE